MHLANVPIGLYYHVAIFWTPVTYAKKYVRFRVVQKVCHCQIISKIVVKPVKQARLFHKNLSVEEQ